MVVGAGPVGGKVAGIIAENGFKVLLIEEHREIGRPLQCAGLVTPRVLRLVDFDVKILNRVRGAEIFSPLGSKLKIQAGETKALVIDRAGFDKAMIKDAVIKGAVLSLGTKVVSAVRSNGCVELRVIKGKNSEKIIANLLIGADGVQCNIARWFKLPLPKIMLSAFESEMVNVRLEPEFVKVFIGKSIAPNFFAWAIPLDEEGSKANIGLCSFNAVHNAHHYFKRLLELEFLREARALRYMAGAVPIGTSDKTYDDNVMIVGDAAGQVKPTSGGGVYYGIKCAEHCGVTAVKALEEQDFSSSLLSEYQSAWQRDIGRELKRGLRLHKIFCSLKDEDMEKIIKVLSREENLSIISEYGDIDYPSKLALMLFRKSPSLIKYLGPIVKGYFNHS